MGTRARILTSSLIIDGNPEFATVLRVVQALGLRLCVAPANSEPIA
jgi:DNA-binding phage protein